MSKKLSFKTVKENDVLRKSDDHVLDIQSFIDKREKMKRLVIDIPEQLHKQLKSCAVGESKAMCDIVRGCIERYLDDKMER